MEDVFATVLRWLDLPFWQLALIVTATTAVTIALGGRLPLWSKPLLTALRVAAVSAMKWPKMPKVTPGEVPVRDPNHDDAGMAPTDQPAVLVERTDAEMAADRDRGG